MIRGGGDGGKAGEEEEKLFVFHPHQDEWCLFQTQWCNALIANSIGDECCEWVDEEEEKNDEDVHHY